MIKYQEPKFLKRATLILWSAMCVCVCLCVSNIYSQTPTYIITIYIPPQIILLPNILNNALYSVICTHFQKFVVNIVICSDNWPYKREKKLPYWSECSEIFFFFFSLKRYILFYKPSPYPLTCPNRQGPKTRC